MRKRRLVILGLVAGSWLAIACSSGGGGLIAVGDGYDTPPDTRDKPGAGREVPPSSIDDPTPNDPGGGGGGGGGGASCPPCDQKLSCTDANQKKQSITLKTQNGQCSAGDGVTFDCQGHILQNGQSIGTWSGSNGTFTIKATSDGKSITLTCTAGASPSPTGTGTGTAPTPTPTPTTTNNPPPTDAGTKG
jgi:hypothetical protein